MAMAAARANLSGIVVPFGNRREASVVAGIDTIPVRTLSDLVEYLCGNSAIEPLNLDLDQIFNRDGELNVDFDEVVGQEHVKRAMEIAAAGGQLVGFKQLPAGR